MKQTMRLPHRLRTINPMDSRYLLHHMWHQPGQSVTSLSALGSLSPCLCPCPLTLNILTSSGSRPRLLLPVASIPQCDVMDSTSGSVLQANRSVDHNTDLRVQPTTQTAYTGSPLRVIRSARPSYTDEQRLSIMYYHIVGSTRGPK
jgi:hypothetical protein